MRMQKLQQTQPKEQRVGKTNVSIGSNKVGTVQIIKQKQFIAVSATTSCDIKGKRESKTVSTQTTNEMKREKQGEKYHESSPSVLSSYPSSDCSNMDFQMFSTGTKMVHHDDLVGDETVGNETVGNGMDSGMESNSDSDSLSTVSVDSTSGSSTPDIFPHSNSNFNFNLNASAVAAVVKYAYDVKRTPIPTEDHGPNLVHIDSAREMSPNELRRGSTLMTAQMNSLSSKGFNDCIGDSRHLSLDNLSDSDSDIDLDSDLRSSPSGVFREKSAKKWTPRDIECTKNEMAQQMVYLQTKMITPR